MLADRYLQRVTRSKSGRGLYWPDYSVGVRGPWPFVGRRSELDRAAESARVGHGVLAVGTSGVGKTAFIREFVARLAGSSTDPIQVAGQALLTGTPYAVVPAPFNAHGRPELPVAPAEIAARMAVALGTNAAGQRLLVVDDLPLVDEHSAAVVFELAAHHNTIVLATAQELPVSEGGRRLWREGYLDRLELPGLATDEVAEFLETGLQGPVEMSTVLTFARRSQGNPLVLRELAVAALSSGALVARNGWRLVASAPVGGGARELVGRRLDAVAGPERAALELVAATEPIRLDAVLEFVRQEILDTLESDHLVAIRSGAGGAEVTTAHPLYGEILRETMPSVRLRRFRLDLAQRSEAAPDPKPVDLLRAALWRLEDGQPQSPWRLLRAARTALGMSLEVAERLARHALDCGGGVAATVLLAQILVHAGRGEEAASLAAQLPPASLSNADREALTYCAAMGQGLIVGNTAHGVELLDAILSGNPSASADLRALQAALLAFDARHEEALECGREIVADPHAAVSARALASIGVVGAEYWLGDLGRAAEFPEGLTPVLQAARETVPYAECSVLLISVCALLDRGEPAEAERRADAMRQQALGADDKLALPRSEYLLGRVDLYRGRGLSAVQRLRRCVTSLSPFDQFARRHLWGYLARAEAETGDLAAADEALVVGSTAPVLKTYEPDWHLARAAVLAARLALEEAADLATWAASIAADQRQWGSALLAYHDAARYGAARDVVQPMRRLPPVDSPLFTQLIARVAADAASDGDALDAVAGRLEQLGALAWAREAAVEAARARARAGSVRGSRASAGRAARLAEQGETPLPPWLVDLGEGDWSLTARERQVALLAAAGHSDKSIAVRLGVSPRTVSTHLSRCYVKLGVTGREGLAEVIGLIGQRI